jgi:hypothetical protein
MDSSKQYREFGELCDRMAIEPRGEQYKKILREMAVALRALAEEIEMEGYDR